MKNSILLTFALRDESRGIRWEPALPVRILHTGIGELACREAIRREILASRPNFVISTGFAGGLDPELRPGDVVLSADHSNVELTEMLLQDAEKCRVHVRIGEILTVDAPATTAEEKAILHARTGADVIDMETAHIAAVCQEFQVPLIAFRAVCDPADASLTVPIEYCVDLKTHETRPFKLAGYLAGHPWKLPSVLRLVPASIHARNSLRLLIGEFLSSRNLDLGER